MFLIDLILKRTNFTGISKLIDKRYFVQQIYSSAFFKILVNYLQTISIIQSLRLNWSAIMSQLFLVQSVSSGGMGKTANMECLLDCYNYNLFHFYPIKNYFNRYEFNYLL